MLTIITQFIDIILHLDVHLTTLLQNYGVWTYAILFLIIFCETGLVVTPFLPGDSLLFAIGALAALNALDIKVLLILLTTAAILGDTLNYWIGSYVGPKIFRRENVRFLNKEHLNKTHAFYEKYGPKTIIIARFLPIIRTFAPFVAGIAKMSYWKFIAYNIVGGVAWIFAFLLGGYFFGNIPIVKNNFTVVILVIIVVSLVPTVIEVVKHYFKKYRQQTVYNARHK